MPPPQASDAPPKNALQKSSILPKQGALTKAPLKQTNKPSSAGPAKATAAQGGMPMAAGNQENFGAENPGNGRPTRSNHGNRLLEMEKTSEVIGHDLDRINRKRAGTFLEEPQDTMPGIPENPMAPPAPKRRKSTKKKDALKSVIPADPPLQKTAPRPIQSGPPSGVYPRPQDLNADRQNNAQSQQFMKPPVVRTYGHRANALGQPKNTVEKSAGNSAPQPCQVAQAYGVFAVRPRQNENLQPMPSQQTHCPHEMMDQDDGRDGYYQNTITPKAPQLFLLDDMQPPQSPVQGKKGHRNRSWCDEDRAYEPDVEEEGGDCTSGDMGYEEGSQQVDDFYQASDDDHRSPHWANNRAIAQPMLQDDRNPFREQYYPGDIDENSPSEDEQNALAAIQQRQSEAPDDIAAVRDLDVLEEHRKKNRPNRAPQPAHLEAAAERQQRVQDMAQEFLTQGEHEESSDEEEEEEEEDSSCSEEGHRTRAPRNSHFDGEIKPTTLGYYRGTFKDAIEQAKKEFRGYVMLHNGFPERSKHLHEAGHVLTQTIEKCTEEGYVFDKNDIQTRNTNIVVFKEASTYRGKMKILARHLVPRFYKEELNPDFSGGNQLEQQGIVSANVADLLGDESPYLLNGKDEQGRSNNIAHPCIRELCIQHFYGNGQDSIAKTFEDHFKDSIPEHAIAIVMACIYNALEEYELGYFRKCPFKGARYKEIYETSLDLIEEVKASPYHKAKWDDSRRRWARDGMKLLNPATERRKAKMKVHVD